MTMSTKKAITPLRAITYAAQMHDGQMRKDDETPYIAHPIRVMAILSEVFGVRDEDVLAAAVLHDTIEDTEADWFDIEERFGRRIAGYVDLLSKNDQLEKPERERQYMRDLVSAPVNVRLCKLADIYDNLSDTDALSADKIAKTVNRAERLCHAMTDDFPANLQHIVDIMDKKILSVKSQIVFVKR